MAYHPETALRTVLAQQRQLIDRDRRIAARPREQLFQRRHDDITTLDRNSSGQRHVKAEVLEEIRVAPAVEMADLPSVQSRGDAPSALLRRHRRAVSIEQRHA